MKTTCPIKNIYSKNSFNWKHNPAKRLELSKLLIKDKIDANIMFNLFKKLAYVTSFFFYWISQFKEKY